MEQNHSLNRRRFLKISTGIVTTGVSLTGCGREPRRWRFFTPEEGILVEALADQVIPPDQDPGGKWAGVADFIDRQLVGHYKRHQQGYRQGLAAVEETSVALMGRGFLELRFNEQTVLLEAMERDELPDEIWRPQSAAEFFNLILDHCLQGFYGNPRHGGNRDFVSYKMIGLDYPQLVGRVKS